MSEETKSETTETPGAGPTKAASILEDVNGIIKGSALEVRKRVVEALAEKAIAENVRLVQSGLEKRNEALTNVRKLNKPDNVSYDMAGNKVESMSSARFEELKKAKEQLDKIEKALAKALDDNDYSKLKEICK